MGCTELPAFRDLRCPKRHEARGCAAMFRFFPFYTNRKSLSTHNISQRLLDLDGRFFSYRRDIALSFRGSAEGRCP
jgi:hypothetical protein